jgi:alkylhydroperoxidase family enzyme
MAYIETTSPGQAEGRLKSLYDAALQRAGRVFQILQIQSPNPAVLAASMGLYQAVMFGPSPLSRVEREALAVVVSRANDCFY